MSDTTTRGIRVEVESFFVPARSSPHEDYYFFAYKIRISNEGDETAQLISRVWIITDSNGQQQRVEGPGVVGEQPILAPGESFEYTSFCPLSTPVGSMEGSYSMRTDQGETFDAGIGSFALVAPHAVN
ncbi:MAG TPA: Co2+/Mg2+ efflux protein ApaG [Thermoanaerobaculia bacterium]|nr:Co2+/Mg2+ efflux protein ApaG [Thermoanaerobaculia bacterium]